MDLLTVTREQSGTRTAGAAGNDKVVRRRPVLMVVLVAAVLLVTVALPVATTVVAGRTPYERLVRDYPGLDVGVVTTVLRAVADVAATLTAGALVIVLFLTVNARRAPLTPSWEIGLLRAASAAWATSAGGLVVFSGLDAAGIPLHRLEEPGAFTYAYQASDGPLAWTITLVAAFVVFVGAQFARRWTGLLVPLWAAAVGLLAPVVVGQVLVGPDHDFGSDAGALQALAVAFALGPVAITAVGAVAGGPVVPTTVVRTFRLAVAALPVVVATEAVLAWFKLSGSSPAETVTGMQIVGQVVCLALMATLAGAAAWSWRAGRLREQHVPWLLTAAGAVIAAWVGIGVAMTRIPPPNYFVPTSISQVFMGFDLPDAPSVEVLVSQWRVNVLFVVLAVGAAGGYLVALRTLRRRGIGWPPGRTFAWLLGWAVVVVATSSGFGRYSTADFGVHMVVHMALNMLAPLLLVLGGPVTLALRATQGRSRESAGTARAFDRITEVLKWRPVHVLGSPLVVFGVFIGSYYGLYLTPAFGELMPYHWAHQLMNLHFLAVGYAYYALIIGVDRPPRPLPAIGRLGYVLAAMPFHAFFGVILMTSTTVIADNFYRNLDLPWADLAASQYLGGGVAWAGGELPLMIVIIVLGVQWARQDTREAARKDRHYDTGRDDEFDEYNRMLQRLAARDTTRSS